MQTNWFYTVWPFIGLGGAIVIVPILLMTDAFRGNGGLTLCSTYSFHATTPTFAGFSLVGRERG
ncbi:MAG TPA: hypothetical protein VNZ26_12575 [Vicinamibacterales bacterium]|jgi:hypothetical protein|nr:hypothetical protein [Vicinamibacterales bacterium]